MPLVFVFVHFSDLVVQWIHRQNCCHQNYRVHHAVSKCSTQSILLFLLSAGQVLDCLEHLL